jgi:hypothetical protein
MDMSMAPMSVPKLTESVTTHLFARGLAGAMAAA